VVCCISQFAALLSDKFAFFGRHFHLSINRLLQIFVHARRTLYHKRTPVGQYCAGLSAIALSRGIKVMCVCVTLSECLFVHTITQTNDPKVFKLGIGNDLDMLLRLKGQGQSQGQKVQKYIEGTRMAGISYVLYQVPLSIL